MKFAIRRIEDIAITVATRDITTPEYEMSMQLPPLANQQIGRQLAELDREINSALKDIRRNLEVLEEVSRQSDSSRPDQNFADILKNTIEDSAPDSAT